MASEPLKTGTEALGTKVIQIRVENTRTRLQCWNGMDGLPQESAGLPLRHCIIDVLNKNIQYVRDLKAVDGSSIMVNLPVLIIGDGMVVQAMESKLKVIWGLHWTGATRYIDVYMNDTDPQFLFSKRSLCIILPSQ